MPQEKPVLLAAACALLKSQPGDFEARILPPLCRQGKNLAGLWEFSGGKLEHSESPEQALARELREKLGIETAQTAFAPLNFATYACGKWHLRARFGSARRNVPAFCAAAKQI